MLFIALSRSDNPRLHAGVVTLAWLLLASEFAYELERGDSWQVCDLDQRSCHSRPFERGRLVSPRWVHGAGKVV